MRTELNRIAISELSVVSGLASLLIVIVFIKSLPGPHCLPGNRLFVVCIQKILTGATQLPSPLPPAPTPINTNN